ncbi:hypothetical protein PUR26_00015, partial [Streptomyces sp. SP18CS02]|nr:hypothetical protein [Streptomyces sp. SP18CS02]
MGWFLGGWFFFFFFLVVFWGVGGWGGVWFCVVGLVGGVFFFFVCLVWGGGGWVLWFCFCLFFLVFVPP